MPSLFHHYVQIRDGSRTHTAERLKTTISPFSYPRQTRFLTLSLPLKPKCLKHSKAGLQGPCNSCTISRRSTRLIWCGNPISTDPGRIFEDSQCVSEKKPNSLVEGTHFWTNLSYLRSRGRKSQRAVGRFLQASLRAAEGFWGCRSVSIVLFAPVSFSHSLSHTHLRCTHQLEKHTTLSQRTQVSWWCHHR